MNPFSQALLDFHSGSCDVTFTIRRDDGFCSEMPAAPFFELGNYPTLEMRAMDECHGSVLDIGSAAGRHSLELLRRGIKVTSLDILPEMEGIMKDRGQTDVVISDVLHFSGRRFDTLLMLMNGIGIVGSIEGLTRFLQHAHDLVDPGGQIVCDSTDVGLTTEPQHVAYRETNMASGRPAGHQAFMMEYNDEEPVRFDWLHIDFQALERISKAAGWEAILLEQKDCGHYLCKLIEKIKSEQGAAVNPLGAQESKI